MERAIYHGNITNLQVSLASRLESGADPYIDIVLWGLILCTQEYTIAYE